MPENNANPSDEKLLILPLGDESKKITQVISNDTARQIIELLADSSLSASDISERLKAPISTIVYNLENLENVGLIKVERIKYSEKGREVKIYAPVRKLIVVVPEKTDKKSVADLLRKYLGVFLAALFASGIIEFFTRRISMSVKMIKSTGDSLNEGQLALSTNLTYSSTGTVMNETIRSAESYSGIIAAPSVTPVSTIMSKSLPAATYSQATPSAETVNAITTHAPVPTMLQDGGGLTSVTPDIFASLLDVFIRHPGLMFLLGCLFIIIVLAILEYHRKS